MLDTRRGIGCQDPRTGIHLRGNSWRETKVDDPKEQATVTTVCSEGPFDADDVVRAVKGPPEHCQEGRESSLRVERRRKFWKLYLPVIRGLLHAGR